MRLGTVLLLACLWTPASTQQVNQQAENAAAEALSQSEKKPSKELTSEERKAAASMLKVGEAEARALPPDLRAYALLQVARGYSRIEAAKAPELLTEAFTATTAISEDKMVRQSLQSQILRQLLPLDGAKVSELLPQAEEQPRDEIMRQLISQDIRDKKLDKAAELISQIPASEFPYAEAGELMQSFPKEESWRRSAVFAQAIASFAAADSKHAQFGNSLGEMIADRWRDLPPEQVEQAIDEVLKQAKSSQNTTTFGLSSDSGNQVSLASIYEFRLFQLLPILREINKGKAEALLRDDQNVQGLLTKYPNGEDSLSSEPENADAKTGEMVSNSSHSIAMAVSTGSSSPGQAPQLPPVNEGQAWQAQANRIVSAAADDPKQALAQAQTLPVKVKIFGNDFPLRADTLRAIANSCLKSNPTVAKQAVADMVKSMQDLDAKQIQELLEAARLYLKLADQDSAKKVLESAAPKADELVKADENSDDPNRAFKAYWPSAAAWQAILRIAERISPAYAQTMIADISDDQIRTLARIALADELAGAPAGPIIISEKRGKDNRTTMRSGGRDDQD